MRRSSFLWGMLAVLLAAMALRFIAFGQVPAGLYHDEAHHGLDGLGVLQGRLSLYFPANNGREPLFIYLVTLAVGVLGKSPLSLRLPALFVGVLTVAATGAMGRALFSRSVGLLAAAVLAVTLWHVHLSRVGFRAGLLPLFIALTTWQGAQGIKTGRWQHWLAAGILYGLSFYTYTAARFTPVALVAFGVYAVGARPAIRHLRLPATNRRKPQATDHVSRFAFPAPRLWRQVAVAALAALATAAPLAVYTVRFPEIVLGRLGQVSISSPEINGGDFWGTLGVHTLRTLGMFFWRGDRIWRHNIPGRPIFDPVQGLAFVIGLVLVVRRLGRGTAAGFVLIWTAVMSLPTLLAEDAPHFLRTVGVLPVVALFPALGLDWLAGRIGAMRLWRRLPLMSLLLLPSLWLTVTDYFQDYAHDPMTGYWFERGATTLAGRINGFLGEGWDGERMVLGGPDDRHVYLDEALWEEWPQVRFLVAAPEAVTLGLEGGRPDGPVAVFAWPYEDWQRAWALLPAPAEVTVEEGPLSQGDRDPEPYLTYVALYATPPDPAIPALARFSGGVELLGATVIPANVDPASRPGHRTLTLRVRLRWRATAPLADDYTVFLHYLRDGERIAQADARAAAGYYPTTAWHPGDVVNDDHYIAGVSTPSPERDVLLFGLWEPETGTQLYLLDEAGNPLADWIELPVES